MNQLSFSHPELWPWALAVVPLWLLLFGILRARARARAAYGAPLTERVSGPAARATRLTLAAALLLAVWVEPRYGEEQVQVERAGLDLVFALDTSRSMLARDMEPTRLGAAKRDILTVLPDLKGGDRVGLVAFAGEARLMVPLTHDLSSFRQLLEQVDTDAVRRGGTDLAAALRRSLEVIGTDHQATAAIILLTDGEDLTGAGKQAAREAHDRGVVVHAVGYGSTRGSKITLDQSGNESFLRDEKGTEVVSALDSEGLRALASVTGGEFLRTDVMALPLRQLKEKRLDAMVKRAYEKGEETIYKTRFQWVLIPAMLLLLFELIRHGGRRR
ncbi:MAG: VWA domain-containing protein [Planctomycetes bacterium]|nr:VWA domain-containing protein [Planctomycetota bacterium]